MAEAKIAATLFSFSTRKVGKIEQAQRVQVADTYIHVQHDAASAAVQGSNKVISLTLDPDIHTYTYASIPPCAPTPDSSRFTQLLLAEEHKEAHRNCQLEQQRDPKPRLPQARLWIG